MLCTCRNYTTRLFLKKSIHLILSVLKHEDRSQLASIRQGGCILMFSQMRMPNLVGKLKEAFLLVGTLCHSFRCLVLVNLGLSIRVGQKGSACSEGCHLLRALSILEKSLCLCFPRTPAENDFRSIFCLQKSYF